MMEQKLRNTCISPRSLSYENRMELIEWYYKEESDDLKLTKGIINGFIIELIIVFAVFIVAAAI
jgi:hypothetical protein